MNYSRIALIGTFLMTAAFAAAQGEAPPAPPTPAAAPFPQAAPVPPRSPRAAQPAQAPQPAQLPMRLLLGPPDRDFQIDQDQVREMAATGP